MSLWFLGLNPFTVLFCLLCLCSNLPFYIEKQKKNTTILSVFFVDNNKWLNHTVCMCNNEKRKTKSTKETEKEKKNPIFFWRFVVCLQKKNS